MHDKNWLEPSYCDASRAVIISTVQYSLGFRKVYAYWAPLKKMWMRSDLQFLMKCRENSNIKFLNSKVVGNETLISYYIPERTW